MTINVDPFGLLEHVKPVPMEQAVKEYQTAMAKVTCANHALTRHGKTWDQLNQEKEEAIQEMAEKQHQLNISAAQS